MYAGLFLTWYDYVLTKSDANAVRQRGSTAGILDARTYGGCGTFITAGGMLLAKQSAQEQAHGYAQHAQPVM